MTKAPESIQQLASFWVKQGGVNLGIVGDSKHQKTGTSYHLGEADLAKDAYSRTLPRDRNGLADFPEFASALDLGKLDGRIGKLRKFSNWLVNQAQAGHTPDIREIIWSPDGIEVRRWDSSVNKGKGKVIVSLRRNANKTIEIVNPHNGDQTHFRHTHISFYRDSAPRPKVATFKPFFDPKPVPDHQPVPVDEPNPTPDDLLEPEPEDDEETNPADDPVQPPHPEFVKVHPSPHPLSTLSGIAQAFGLTLAKLLAFPENANFRDNPGKVFAGQAVRVR